MSWSHVFNNPVETQDFHSGDTRIWIWNTQQVLSTPHKISVRQGSGGLVSSLIGRWFPPLSLLSTACKAVINAVALKLPKLWTGWVRGWFSQAEVLRRRQHLRYQLQFHQVGPQMALLWE